MRISDWSSDVCSSDLHQAGASRCPRRTVAGIPRVQAGGRPFPGDIYVQRPIRNGDSTDRDECRSEEHTSELQSLMRISYAVFCLKKKTTKNKQHENTRDLLVHK